MPNLKISELPAATTPLAGTETVPVVQGGVTEKVSVADLTAGRTVDASKLVLAAGSSAAPSLTTSASTTTGVSFPGADTVDVSTAGTSRVRVHSGGTVSIGSTLAFLQEKVTVAGNLPSSLGLSIGYKQGATTTSSTTSQSYGFSNSLSTQAASFTLTSAYHFAAAQGTIGAGSSISVQNGFYADSNITSAGTNYGFYSGIPLAAGRYNFYAAGSADNYFVGKVQSADLVMPGTKAPTTKNASVTLAGGELVTGILQLTGGTGLTITLPTGADIESALQWTSNNVSLDWFVISAGAAGTVTIGANGNTTVGALLIAAGASAHFRIRRTAPSTFTIYRLA